jgi:hypothetical protein
MRISTVTEPHIQSGVKDCLELLRSQLQHLVVARKVYLIENRTEISAEASVASQLELLSVLADPSHLVKLANGEGSNFFILGEYDLDVEFSCMIVQLPSGSVSMMKDSFFLLISMSLPTMVALSCVRSWWAM